MAAGTLFVFAGATTAIPFIPMGREVTTDTQGKIVSKLIVNSPTIAQTLIDCPNGALKLTMSTEALIRSSPENAGATVGALDQG